MKKLLLSLIALIAFSFNASADDATASDIIGNEDNSTEWWSDFSDYVTLKGDASATVTFKNYSDKVYNWDNWLLVCTNDVDRGGTGYSEYFVMRADNYGWGSGWNTANDYSLAGVTMDCPGTLESHYNWDTFKDDMDGATVNITLFRKGNKIKMRALTTTAAGAQYFETYEQEVENLPETIRYFITTEKGHLTDFEITYNSFQYSAYGASGKYTASGYETLNYISPEIENIYTEVYEGGVHIYDYCGVPGYDILVGYDDNGITSIMQEVYGVLKERSQGSYYYAYTGLETPSITDFGFYTPYSYIWSDEGTTNSGNFLAGAYGYVGADDTTGTWGYYYFGWGESAPTGISAISADKSSVEGPAYNLAGQRVSKAAKGLVIMNGKKYFNK